MTLSPSVQQRQRVAQAFAQATGSYDQAAAVQQQIGRRLLTWGSPGHVDTLVDLGCGTGAHLPAMIQRYRPVRAVGIDLAQPMVRATQARCPQALCLVADADRLPLAARSIDCLISNLAVQWSLGPESICAQAARVLRPGGRVLLSTLLPGTFAELQQAWRAVGITGAVNTYPSLMRWRQAACNNGLTALRMYCYSHSVFYQQAIDFVRELKQLGAQTSLQVQQASRQAQAFRAMLQQYQHWHQPRGLPVTYRVLLLEGYNDRQ